MSKHTKGKWDFSHQDPFDDKGIIFSDRGQTNRKAKLLTHIATVEVQNHNLPDYEGLANARLIAKAYLIPEMRDKLVAVFNDINALYQTYLETIEKEEIDSQLDQDIQLTTSRLGSIEALIKEIDNG